MLDIVRPTAFDAILEAAFAVLNAEPKASLADIAAAAGVGRATLHRHFGGREDLIRALAQQAQRETEQAANKASEHALSYSAALRQILKAMIVLGDRHWFLAHESMTGFPEVRAEYDRQRDELVDAIEEARKEGLFHSACPVEWIVQTYDHLIHAGWEMVRAGHATHAQAADLAWLTLKSGLKQAKL